MNLKLDKNMQKLIKHRVNYDPKNNLTRHRHDVYES